MTKYIYLCIYICTGRSYYHRETSLHATAEFRNCAGELKSKFPPVYLVPELSQL